MAAAGACPLLPVCCLQTGTFQQPDNIPIFPCALCHSGPAPKSRRPLLGGLTGPGPPAHPQPRRLCVGQLEEEGPQWVKRQMAVDEARFFLRLGSSDEQVLGTDCSQTAPVLPKPFESHLCWGCLMGVDTGTLWGHGYLWEQPLGTAPLFPAEPSPSLEQFIISLSLSLYPPSSCAFVGHNQNAFRPLEIE